VAGDTHNGAFGCWTGSTRLASQPPRCTSLSRVVDGPCLIRLEGRSEAGTGPRSLVLATGDAQAGTRSQPTSTWRELVVEGDSYRRRQRPRRTPS